MSMPDKKMLAVSRLPPSSKALMALSLRSSTGLRNVLGLWSIPFVYTSDITSVCAMYLSVVPERICFWKRSRELRVEINGAQLCCSLPLLWVSDASTEILDLETAPEVPMRPCDV